MTQEEIKIIVNQFFDKELDKAREPLLFTILSENEEARDYFKQLNLMHTAAEEMTEEFPDKLEQRIFRAIERTETKSTGLFKRNFFVSAASLGIAALMLIVSAFLFWEVREYRYKMELVSEQVRAQNQTIELILNNSLPPAEVSTRRVHEIIVKANL